MMGIKCSLSGQNPKYFPFIIADIGMLALLGSWSSGRMESIHSAISLQIYKAWFASGRWADALHCQRRGKRRRRREGASGDYLGLEKLHRRPNKLSGGDFQTIFFDGIIPLIDPFLFILGARYRSSHLEIKALKPPASTPLLRRVPKALWGFSRLPIPLLGSLICEVSRSGI